MATLSNTKIKDTYQSLVKFNDNGNITTSPKRLTDGFGNVSPFYVSTTQVGIGTSPNSSYDLHVYGNVKVGANLDVSGNLTVNGTLTYLNVTDLAVEDPLIKLAKDNDANTLDIGLFGKYAISTNVKYKGFFNDASDDKFKLFTGLTTEPTTTVDTSDSGYAVGTLVADVEGTLTGVIASSTTATTQNADDNSTKVATTAYVDTAAGNYLPLSGGTMTGDIAMGSNNISGGGTATFTTFTGNLTGNVTGDVTGDLTGDVTGGTISGTTGSFSGRITAQNGINVTGGSTGADIYINNTSPTLGFTDSNSFSDANDIYIIRGGGTDKLQFNWYDDSANTTTQTFIIDSSGNAIFAGDITTNGDIIIDNSTGDPFLKLKTAAQEYVIRIDQSDSEKFQIRDVTNSATRMTIDTSGNATFSGNILPNADSSYNIGANNNKWAEGHFDHLYIGETGNNPRIDIYTEDETAAIADTFADTTTDKSYIYFNAGTSSNDPGYIMHETSNSETNEGVLHLVPSDDNNSTDYVSIHGTNDPDSLKLHTSGLISTANGIGLQLTSDTGTITLNDSISGTTGTFSGQLTIPETPTADAHAASKKYVDDNTGTSDVAKRLEVTVKNVSGASLAKGTVVHAAPTASPPSGNVIEVIAADANNAAKMPAIGVLNETIADEAEGEAVMFGAVSGIDTSSFSIGDELYVSETAGEFTATKPTAYTSQVQKIAVVIKSHASNGLIKVFGAGRSNDVPNRVDRDMNFTDDSVLSFGTGEDIKIYHNSTSTNANIENHTGSLYITNYADDEDIIFRNDNGSGGVIEYFRLDGSTNVILFGRSPHIS